MTLRKLFLEAEAKLICGWSDSRVVDFVLQNANNDIEANRILNMLIKVR
tara:strand:- start:19229 stop:19375 length:147 start_codon:yes stop_codon:yes gene_type:complete